MPNSDKPRDQNWDAVKTAWRDRAAQEPTHATANPAALAAGRSSGFDRTIRRRNAVETVAFALVGVFFAADALGLFGRAGAPMADLLQRVGALAVVVGVMVAVWQLYRRASVLAPDPVEDVVTFHRRQLERQRNALNSVGRWYLGPFLPGFALMAIGGFLEPGAEPIILALAIGVVAVVFSAILVLNRRAAAGLQREIEDLDRVGHLDRQ